MSKSSKPVSESSESPVLFAGVKFYEVLMRNVTMIDEAAQLGLHDQWIRGLRTFYSKAGCYIQLPDIKEKLTTIKKNLSYYKTNKNVSNYQQCIEKAERQLFEVQDDLFRASRDLFVKPATKDIEDFDIDELRELKT